MATELTRAFRKGASSLAALWLLLLHATFARAAEPTAAEELVREAHAHEAAHDYDVALRRYADALALDPTLGDGYLGLGALRLSMGDAREAVRVYDAGLTHLVRFPEARLGRGKALRAMRELARADADLEEYTAKVDDADALHLLAHWYADEGRPLAQLATWRRLLARESARSDAAALKEARLMVHALERIVGDADPVRSPPGDAHASSVRRGLARIDARR